MIEKPLVCILTYNQLCIFEYGIALEVFDLPRPEFEQWYDYKIIATNKGDINGLGGVSINATNDLSLLAKASLIVVPGWHGEVSDELREALLNAHDNGARIATICSGVFLPAAIGLLDGKTASTHWRYAEKLKSEYPKITVNAAVLYLDEGSILTSAGSAAGIDLCLHIVRNDFGSEIANIVARRLVLPAHREGGQAQYVPRPSPKNNDFFPPLLDEIRTTLNEQWTVERMANKASMSPRTLLRRFKDTTGESPLKWVIMERLSLARELLETTKLNVNQIADASGFVSPELLRLHFKRQYQSSPLRYRSQFHSA
ncbi:MAG: AraC family transcriptional activator FtrA [Cocleimonas sp.]|jgi:AraC family transcriptional activator FtrA